MDQEVLNQLLVDITWPQLRKSVYKLLEFPDDLSVCIGQADINELHLMSDLIGGSNLQDQLCGLSELLRDALKRADKPNKYSAFKRILLEKIAGDNQLTFKSGSLGQLFLHYLALFYTQLRQAQGSVRFDALTSDGLIASLVGLNALVEADLVAIHEANTNKDAILISALVSKSQEEWPRRLLVALVQADQLDQLDQLLPDFRQFFATNFDRSLADLRPQLTTPGGGGRQAARNLLSEALDLYVCLNCPAEDEGSASADEAVVQARPLEPQKQLEQQQQKQLEQQHHQQQQQEPVSSLARSAPIEVSDRHSMASASAAAGDNDDPEDSDADAAEAGLQQMRAYQQELASAGLAGLNAVVVAPTGSGKTLVSIRIAAARLAEEPDAKVCFLADRRHLVAQQSAAFQAQLPTRFASRIVCITGGEAAERTPPLSYCLRDNSVVLASTQILLNSLRDHSEDGLAGDVGRFRLIVFDECHNCAKDHPSNKIMEMYFLYKESRPSARLPQIVGLTASPGTGHANRAADAVQHLLRLCASLDCRRLVTVRRCLDSLGDQVNSPVVQVHHTECKPSDAVLECLNLMMDRAEAGLLAACQRHHGQLQLPQPPQRSSFLYTNFCGDLRRLAFKAGGSAAVDVVAAWCCLHHCNVALLLRSLFRSTDALRYLEEALCDFNVLDKAPTCQLDSELRQQLQRLLPQMREFCTDQRAAASRSPALAVLLDILQGQFASHADSRVLVFVQQRCFTAAVKSFLETPEAVAAAPALARADARVGVITGANAAGGSFGSTQTGQTDLLAAFRRGTVKILVSTSVTEEGLDVQKCNAVVRFCHVTNEIAMVQSRGRGRAQGSVYHVIVPAELAWLSQKERTNQARDAMMQAAVAQLGDLPEDEFVRKVLQVQREQRLDAQLRRDQQAAAASANASAAFRLLCWHCGEFLTNSSSLRLAQGCHRLALDEDLLRSRLEARRESAEMAFVDYAVLGVALLCKHCGNKVGSLCRYKDLPFPELSIKDLVFVNAATGTRQERLKKWKMAQKFFTEVEVTGPDLVAWARLVPEIPAHLLRSAAVE